MTQPHRRVITHRRLLVFKWLMVITPPAAALVGHRLLAQFGHGLLGREHDATNRLGENLLVALLLLVISFVFAELLFRVLGNLQAEALAREQDVLTMGAVIQERARLSRELHDGVVQLVADLLIRLDTIKELVVAGRQHEAEAELERLHVVANEIYVDIGESITGLRADVTERGLISAVRNYVDQFEERHQICTALQADEAADRLPPLAALQVFRFIQEALTNVRKHAGAREAKVTLAIDPRDHLSVVVADDGVGFMTDGQNGGARSLGLTSMRERSEALGGSFSVKSLPGSGTEVIAVIPIQRTKKASGHAALPTPAS